MMRKFIKTLIALLIFTLLQVVQLGFTSSVEAGSTLDDPGEADIFSFDPDEADIFSQDPGEADIF